VFPEVLMGRRSKSSQFDLFRLTRRSPEVPGEVRQKMIHLLARMLRQHAARGLDRRPVPEANHE
jgi:hypothetical protein